MKYVIFKKEIEGAITYHPIIMAEHSNHCDVVYNEKNAVIHSAGFFIIRNGIVEVLANKIPTSLPEIKPTRGDEKLLTWLLTNHGMSSFVDYGN